MIICGLKLTHDGTIALIDNNKLVFSYEMEKLNNNARFSNLLDFDIKFLEKILHINGYSLGDIDKIVLDGWGDDKAPVSEVENDAPIFQTKIKDLFGEQIEIVFGRYGMLVKEEEDILLEETFLYEKNHFSYNSYMHVSGHLMSAYCTSPFASKNEDSYILAWDGGMFPQCFYFKAKEKSMRNLGPLFHIKGDTYALFASSYPPFSKLKNAGLSVAGKVMAYIALGQCVPEVLQYFKKLFYNNEEQIKKENITSLRILIDRASNLLKEFVIYGEINDYKPVDMMATYHIFLQDILIEKLEGMVGKLPSYNKNLCFVGGCALNIKWNSQIRDSAIFNEIWVPPFPNDSGSAIGAACCEMIKSSDDLALDWDVYSGPELNQTEIDDNSWNRYDCSIKKLAKIIHDSNEPIVFLNERAELGPRALGNRSILSAAVSKEMKSKLNLIKLREDYRPVAPICIEEAAEKIFSPGTPDPYMLFDHTVREEWVNKIPAISHLDGSARLQTVNSKNNDLIYNLLVEYGELSGVPLLCNTSANLNGKGFFPDVQSVIEWGQVNFIWSNGEIFIKKGDEREKYKMEFVIVEKI